jgi:acetyl-CoA decarbonylase/synthase complex subunit gamma
MAISGLDIYKLLPKTNCKECGFPTCLAFAMKLAAKQADLSACPYVSEESKSKLSAASAPPIRLVTIAADGHKIEAGNETVLFRHEKTFYHPTGLLVRIQDSLPAEQVAATAKAVADYKVDYVGISLHLDGLAVEATSGDASKFAAAVAAARQAGSLPLVLISEDPLVMLPVWPKRQAPLPSSARPLPPIGKLWRSWPKSIRRPWSCAPIRSPVWRN